MGGGIRSINFSTKMETADHPASVSSVVIQDAILEFVHKNEEGVEGAIPSVEVVTRLAEEEGVVVVVSIALEEMVEAQGLEVLEEGGEGEYSCEITCLLT